jgi:flavin reductase (DIM6/NTAB) family NADH-FMN oxidoreductase RutF/DNA-binding IclR family transcriptional regulator
MSTRIDPAKFRQVLGQYPTGVVVVTARNRAGKPLGMTVGSFTSVSLDPPLVAFLPDQNSRSWQALRDSGERFCVNILSAGQEAVCRSVAGRKEDKFDGIDLGVSPAGNPLIRDAVAYVDCTVEVVHDAGDHHIVVGRVQHLETQNSTYPLLFFRGGYGSFSPLSLGAVEADLVGQMRLVDLIRPTLEQLADDLSTEVSALCLAGDELVIAASAGQERSADVPTRVGQRWPFIPPMGSLFAAGCGPSVRERWLGARALDSRRRAHAEWLLRRAAEDGYVLTLSATAPADRVDTIDVFRSGEATITPALVERALRAEELIYNPADLDARRDLTLRSLSVPVLAGPGNVLCTLTVWGSQAVAAHSVSRRDIVRMIAAADAASRVLGEIAPCPPRRGDS